MYPQWICAAAAVASEWVYFNMASVCANHSFCFFCKHCWFFWFFFFFGLIKFLVLKHLRQMPLHHTHQSVQWETPCDIVIRKTVSKSFCLVDNNYLTNKHVIMWWTRNNLEYEAASNQRLFERGATRPTMSSHNHDVTQRRCGHRRQADARLKCLNQFT